MVLWNILQQLQAAVLAHRIPYSPRPNAGVHPNSCLLGEELQGLLEPLDAFVQIGFHLKVPKTWAPRPEKDHIL